MDDLLILVTQAQKVKYMKDPKQGLDRMIVEKVDYQRIWDINEKFDMLGEYCIKF